MTSVFKNTYYYLISFWLCLRRQNISLCAFVYWRCIHIMLAFMNLNQSNRLLNVIACQWTHHDHHVLPASSWLFRQWFHRRHSSVAPLHPGLFLCFYLVADFAAEIIPPWQCTDKYLPSSILFLFSLSSQLSSRLSRSCCPGPAVCVCRCVCVMSVWLRVTKGRRPKR